jgi:hypothetical protein
MQIQRCKALQILEVLGFNTMEKQPNKVLANRLLNIDSYITPDTVFTGDDLDLVDEMALAESITVTGEMGVVAPRRKKKKINVEILLTHLTLHHRRLFRLLLLLMTEKHPLKDAVGK